MLFNIFIGMEHTVA